MSYLLNTEKNFVVDFILYSLTDLQKWCKAVKLSECDLAGSDVCDCDQWHERVSVSEMGSKGGLGLGPAGVWVAHKRLECWAKLTRERTKDSSGSTDSESDPVSTNKAQ